MAEVSVEFIKGEKYLTWYSDDFAIIRHIKKLQNEHPDDVVVVAEDESSIVVHVPVNWFREPKPKAKREMTEEQRLAAAERLAKGRSLKHT
nr:MAG TPA: hypothetical protein [Caudoviricetes sp.]